MLEFGANPNTYGMKSDCYKTPLHRARTQKVVYQLLKHGADPNAKMIDSNKNKLGIFIRNNVRLSCKKHIS